MAKLEGDILFTGTMKNMTAYKMRGSDKIIIRMKGGAEKEKIKNDPNFVNTRRNNSEWKACTQAAKLLRRSMSQVIHMADYNISGPLKGLTNKIVKLSNVGEWGKRPVHYSKFKELLEGFNFNRQYCLIALCVEELIVGYQGIQCRQQ